eukprot:2304034-Rhodomonas_salina.1
MVDEMLGVENAMLVLDVTLLFVLTGVLIAGFGSLPDMDGASAAGFACIAGIYAGCCDGAYGRNTDITMLLSGGFGTDRQRNCFVDAALIS